MLAFSLILLTALATIAALTAAKFSLDATKVRNQLDPLLEETTRPDRWAGIDHSALAASMRAQGHIDAFMKDAVETGKLNQRAINCTIASALFSALAGIVAALAG